MERNLNVCHGMVDSSHLVKVRSNAGGLGLPLIKFNWYQILSLTSQRRLHHNQAKYCLWNERTAVVKICWGFPIFYDCWNLASLWERWHAWVEIWLFGCNSAVLFMMSLFPIWEAICIEFYREGVCPAIAKCSGYNLDRPKVIIPGSLFCQGGSLMLLTTEPYATCSSLNFC